MAAAALFSVFSLSVEVLLRAAFLGQAVQEGPHHPLPLCQPPLSGKLLSRYFWKVPRGRALTCHLYTVVACKVQISVNSINTLFSPEGEGQVAPQSSFSFAFFMTYRR